MNVRLMKERLIKRAQRGDGKEGVDDFLKLSIFSVFALPVRSYGREDDMVVR